MTYETENRGSGSRERLAWRATLAVLVIAAVLMLGAWN